MPGTEKRRRRRLKNRKAQREESAGVGDTAHSRRLLSTRLETIRGELDNKVRGMMAEDRSPALASLVTALLKVETELSNALAKEAREGATLDDSPAEVAGWLLRHLEDLQRISRLPRGAL